MYTQRFALPTDLVRHDYNDGRRDTRFGRVKCKTKWFFFFLSSKTKRQIKTCHPRPWSQSSFETRPIPKNCIHPIQKPIDNTRSKCYGTPPTNTMKVTSRWHFLHRGLGRRGAHVARGSPLNCDLFRKCMWSSTVCHNIHSTWSQVAAFIPVVWSLLTDSSTGNFIYLFFPTVTFNSVHSSTQGGEAESEQHTPENYVVRQKLPQLWR